MIIICDNYIDGIFKTANFKFLNLNYILCYSHPRVTFPPASKVQKNLCSKMFIFLSKMLKTGERKL